eukprot:scaffold239593_cov17-Prasinocladus_malaysianus.AAC.1
MRYVINSHYYELYPRRKKSLHVFCLNGRFRSDGNNTHYAVMVSALIYRLQPIVPTRHSELCNPCMVWRAIFESISLVIASFELTGSE